MRWLCSSGVELALWDVSAGSLTSQEPSHHRNMARIGLLSALCLLMAPDLASAFLPPRAPVHRSQACLQAAKGFGASKEVSLEAGRPPAIYSYFQSPFVLLPLCSLPT